MPPLIVIEMWHLSPPSQLPVRAISVVMLILSHIIPVGMYLLVKGSYCFVFCSLIDATSPIVCHDP